MWGSVGTAIAAWGQKEAFFFFFFFFFFIFFFSAATVAAASQNSKSLRLGTSPASLRVAEGWYVGG